MKKDVVTRKYFTSTRSVPVLFKDKNGISPVVATALLLVVAVVAVVGFQNWFGSYSTEMFVKTEKDSAQTSQTNIETLVGDQLYFKNTLDDNVTIKQIKLGDRECNISLNVSPGIQNISLGDCVNNLTLDSSVGDITVITENKIYTKKHLFKDVNVVTSVSSPSIPENPQFYSYNLSNSIFVDGEDDGIIWTPGIGNRQIFTISGWMKKVDSEQHLLTADDDAAWMDSFYINPESKINFVASVGNTGPYRLSSERTLNDESDFYHFHAEINTTEPVDSDRVKIYLNGKRITSFTIETYPPQNFEFEHYNNARTLGIGRYWPSQTPAAYHNEGYFSEIHFIDGQALTPDNFGQFNEYGKWVPKGYQGTYGTNGFHLTFENSSNLGQDFSGNENNFTIVGSPIQTKDTPTDNQVTLNSNIALTGGTQTFSSGNTIISQTGDGGFYGPTTMSLPKTGNWTFAVHYNADTSNSLLNMISGIGYSNTDSANMPEKFKGIMAADNLVAYGVDQSWNGNIFGVSPDGDHTIIYAVDMDAKKMYVSIDGTWYKNDTTSTIAPNLGGDPYCDISDMTENIFFYGSVHVANSHPGTHTMDLSFDGANSFSFIPPTGFNFLSSKDLEDPTVISSEGFDIINYTGTEVARDISGLAFSPDLIWIKNRDSGMDHRLFDSLRGPEQMISSDLNAAQSLEPNTVISFNSDGFSLGNYVATNKLEENHIAWMWKEDPNFGFDIVNYVGTGLTNHQIGHNLGAKPELIIWKNLNDSQDWLLWHKNLSQDLYLFPNLQDVQTTGADIIENLNSTHMQLGVSAGANWGTKHWISYLFISIPGYSKIGTYWGNADIDGPFIYTGFKPKYVLIKNAAAVNSWTILDEIRSQNNSKVNELYVDQNIAEQVRTGNGVEFLSNGFKIRTTNGNVNHLNAKTIYIAFADYPFK